MSKELSFLIKEIEKDLLEIYTKKYVTKTIKDLKKLIKLEINQSPIEQEVCKYKNTYHDEYEAGCNKYTIRYAEDFKYCPYCGKPIEQEGK